MSNYNYNNMLFAMSNDRISNSISLFNINSKGLLSFQKSYATGGKGKALGTQGALILSENGKWLFAVNAGSNTISVFRVCPQCLKLTDVVPSGGIYPSSLTIICNNLYVTNSGDASNASNVTGFYLKESGHLCRISNAQRPLSCPCSDPGCIVSSCNGKLLAVTEKSTNRITTFEVNENGSLQCPTINPSKGMLPFGEVFLNSNYLLVAEENSNEVSSYKVYKNGVLKISSYSTEANQKQPCWISADCTENYAYVSNFASNTVSSYKINENGKYLTLVNTAFTEPDIISGPIDNVVDKCNKNLYVLNFNDGSISVFNIGAQGNLTLLQVYEDDQSYLKEYASGLAIL